jgi:chemotaxis response regulator CheB
VKRIGVDLDKGDKGRGGGRTILVVDDNPGIRQAVCRAFLSDGFAVCGEADNGQEAISVCKRFRPDIILLGLSMPVMNGGTTNATPVVNSW